MRIGYRTIYLILLGATFTAYGTGIILGYRPTFFHVDHLSVFSIGWMFIGAGFFMLTGLFYQRRLRKESDRAYFSLAALISTAWATTISLLWTQPVGWTAAVSWICVSIGCVIAAAWPDPSRRKEDSDARHITRIPDD